MQRLHEEILKVSREKNRRHFLSNPEWGVGSTSVRAKNDHPLWCQFCGEGEFICFGNACMGVKPASKITPACTLSSSRFEGNIPGLEFKKYPSSTAARLPRERRTLAASTFQRLPKYSKGGGGTQRTLKYPRGHGPFSRKIVPKVSGSPQNIPLS